MNTLPILVASGLVGWIVGFFIEKLMLPVLSRLYQRTSWQIDDIVIKSWQGIFQWICLAAAVFMAAEYFELSIANRVLFTDSAAAILVMLFAWGIARTTAGILSYLVLKARGGGKTSSMISAIAYIVVFIVGILVALQTIGIAIAPIVATLGVGGLAIALAIRPALEDVFAGLQILLSNTVKPGDFIEIGGEHRGHVVDIGWRTTILDSFGNSQKIIPNSQLVKSIVINYDRPSAPYSVRLLVGVSYDSDLSKVEKIAINEANKVIKQSDVAIQDFEPIVRFKKFDDSSITMQLIIKAQSFTDQYRLEHDLLKAIHVRFKKEKINIPFPITQVQLKK